MASSSREDFPSVRDFAMLFYNLIKRVLAFISVHIQYEQTLAGTDADV
jgi:hypothetical protein